MRNKFIVPDGRITSHFGHRTFKGKPQFHSGIDLVFDGPDAKGPMHIGVAAPADGMWFASSQRDGGLVGVLVRDDGVQLLLGHLSRAIRGPIRVRSGDWVADSGDSGLKSTGPHLHVSVLRDGQVVNPLPEIVYGDVLPAKGRLISYAIERQTGDIIQNGEDCFSWPLPAIERPILSRLGRRRVQLLVGDEPVGVFEPAQAEEALRMYVTLSRTGRNVRFMEL